VKKVERNKLVRRILGIVLTVALVVGLMPGMVLTVQAADTITVTIDTGASVTLSDTDGDDYYEIGTADEFMHLQWQ